jgi:aminoglycoside phosphotransferase (APT) family kinase protein
VSHGLPRDVRQRVRELIMSLPEDGVLCHGDGHPGNVLMTAAGPVAVDWISAMNSNPLVDVARQHLTLTMVAPAALRESLLTKVDASFIATYAALSGTDAAGLLSEVRPYMVVMAAMRMSESASSEGEKRRLTEYVRSNAGLA